jgi:hypothetical protein
LTKTDCGNRIWTMGRREHYSGSNTRSGDWKNHEDRVLAQMDTQRKRAGIPEPVKIPKLGTPSGAIEINTSTTISSLAGLAEEGPTTS